LYNSDGILYTWYTYQYEYDEQGNWIKKIDFENDVPGFILERYYNYFN